MTRAFGPDLHETAVIYTLFDYFLDLWPSLKILLDFFRISSIDGTCLSKTMKILSGVWAKVAPRAGETLENTRSFVRVRSPKEHPRETQNLPKS